MTLKIGRRRFHALIERNSEMIGLQDGQGTITYLSPSTTRWLGYEPGEPVGRPALDVVHPDDRERIAGLFSKLVERPANTFRTVYRLRRGDRGWS